MTGHTGICSETTGELGLAGSGERCAFLVTNADSSDVAASDRVGERIKRVVDRSEDVLDPDLFEHANQNACYRLRYRRLLAHSHDEWHRYWERCEARRRSELGDLDRLADFRQEEMQHRHKPPP